MHIEGKPEGEYHGVYILLEDIDRAALRRRFGNNDGRLIKTSKDNCRTSVEYDDGPPNEATAAYDAWIAAGPAPGRWSRGGEGRSISTRSCARRPSARSWSTATTPSPPRSSTGGRGAQLLRLRSAGGAAPVHALGHRPGLRPAERELRAQQPQVLPDRADRPLVRRTASRIGRATVCQTQIRKRYLEVMCQLINGRWRPTRSSRSGRRPTARSRTSCRWRRTSPGAAAIRARPEIDKSFGAEYVRLKSWIPARINSVRSQIILRAGCTEGASEAVHVPRPVPASAAARTTSWTTCQPPPSCSMVAAPPATTPDGGAPTDAAPATPPPGGTGGASGSGGSGGSSPGAGGSGGGSAPPATGGMPPGSTTGMAGTAPPAMPPRGGPPGAPEPTPAPTAPAAGGCQIAAGQSAAVPAVIGVLGMLALAGVRRRRSGRAR